MSFRISNESQANFAILSGDYNPLHIDEEFSRRSQFGVPVVHGMHLLLLALEKSTLTGLVQIRNLQIEFRSAVKVDELFSIRMKNEGEVKTFTVFTEDRVCARFKILTEPIDNQVKVEDASLQKEPCSESFSVETDIGISGTFRDCFDKSLFHESFPRISQCMNHADIALLLAITRTIGMKCPGKQALFRSLNWQRVDEINQAAGRFVAKSIDRRFRMVTVKFDYRDVSSTAQVMVRREAVTQHGSDRILDLVNANEFEGVSAIVIGGSRGLGELTTRILALGGAKVLFTYYKGHTDSHTLQLDLGEKVECVQFDAHKPSEHSLNLMKNFMPNRLFYFATPPIVRKSTPTWSDSVYKEFKDVYVDCFSTLISHLNVEGTFYPSSTFLDSNEDGFTEYVQAKLEGEARCEELRKKYPKNRILTVRLPPLITDQTSEKLGSDSSGNILEILPHIRATVGHLG